MISAMTDPYNLFEVIRARLSHDNKPRLKVERTKIDFSPPGYEPPVWGWHNGVRNDFCVYTDACDPTAAYVYVTAENDLLRLTLVVSDGWDVRNYHHPPLLAASLDDDRIADRLVSIVLTASRQAISQRYLIACLVRILSIRYARQEVISASAQLSADSRA